MWGHVAGCGGMWQGGEAYGTDIDMWQGWGHVVGCGMWQGWWHGVGHVAGGGGMW